MRLLMPFALVTAACTFNPDGPALQDGGGDTNIADAARGIDASQLESPDADILQPDAKPILACADWPGTPSAFDPCDDIAVVEDALLLAVSGEYVYLTDTGVLTDPNSVIISHTSTIIGAGTEAPRAVVSGAFEIAAGSTLRATGVRPLMIISWQDMQISGAIDVSSKAGQTGAAANSSACTAAIAGGSDDDGGGGGGGGGFGAVGGIGADARNADGTGGTGGTGGLIVTVPGVRGGCAGAMGGEGDGSNGPGAGGSSGGAIYLAARTTITVSGLIDAGGQSGVGASGNRSGGGGGGSGGLIELESPMVTLAGTSILAANGGGGGGGGNNNPSGPGVDGKASADVAGGGAGESSPTGDGGAGGFLTVPDGQEGTTSGRGGGGGGGGAGHIIIRTETLSNNALVISPAP